MRIPTTLLMIRPVNFGFNSETASSNTFQNRDDEQQTVQQRALKEFDLFVDVLRANKIEVIVINDTHQPHTPDSIFPNNWISFHETGEVIIYPMQAENRRLERRRDIIAQLQGRFRIEHAVDLSYFETNNLFLEGTGSMVLNREDGLAYACLSPRTNIEVLNAFCAATGYKSLVFHAFDERRQPIYHTNVMMCVASRYAIICLDSITNPVERESVVASLFKTQRSIFDISFSQMNNFAGNMLEVFNKAGESLLIMSGSAYRSLSERQIATLQQFSRIVCAEIPTIERNGGGSVRCMLAEINLPILSRL